MSKRSGTKPYKPKKNKTRRIYPKTRPEPVDLTALGQNTTPVARVNDPAEIGRLNRAATDWLRDNDPNASAERRHARRQRAKDKKQAIANPALIAARRKALRLT